LFSKTYRHSSLSFGSNWFQFQPRQHVSRAMLRQTIRLPTIVRLSKVVLQFISVVIQ
jgi:hypothetical protein